MLKKFLASGGWELLPLLTMLLFLTVFLLAMVRVLRMRVREVDHMAALPLEDESPNSAPQGASPARALEEVRC
ncbi:MAG: hypothetical protein IPN34_24585 [Planctomycetes bacterium]|nr:hypothetical protein [Planctomycetota bacterium]